MSSTAKLPILWLLILLLSGACAGVQTKGDAEPSSESVLWQRADTYWQHKIKNELDQMYPFETPAYRKKWTLGHYARYYPGEIHYKGATIKSVKIDGDNALVKVEIRYVYLGVFAPKEGIRSQVGSHWTLVNGEWYHLIAPPGNKAKGPTKKRRTSPAAPSGPSPTKIPPARLDRPPR